MNFLPFLIAKRLYSKQKKRSLILFISILSKIGISIIVFSLIISFSALNGFKILLNEKILSTLPHGIIKLNSLSSLKWKNIIKELNSFPGITYCEPYLTMNGILIKNNNVQFIELKSFSNIQHIKKKLFFQNKKNNLLKKRNFSYEKIIISSHLANNLSIKENDSIKLLVLNQKKKNNSTFQSFSVKIMDIFESNGILDKNIAYIPFEFFQIYNDNVDAIELYMSNPFNADEIIINATKKIDGALFAYTWINSYKNIFNDIQVIKTTLYLILLLLVILSCFSIISISIMTISKKTQEIAILRSMGANNFLIQTIFLYYGLKSILLSSFIGFFLGITIVLNFKNIILFLDKHFKDNILLDNIYYNNFLLLKLDISDLIVIFFSTMIIGILANWYPANYASRIHPSEILKEY